ncbi:hypothetical protein GCM10008905_24100 [Clostridium malenominatum]|uniref:Phosphodiester glycosidase domain-containing protein n=1 Tax=Clostridium malenominatum TaxID=1539 RepID=A0ABP3U8H8_9CLOT
MNVRNKGIFSKRVASMIVFTTVVANVFSPISVQALGKFDFTSSLVSKEINKEEFVLVPGVKEKRYSFNDRYGKRLEVLVAEVDTKNPYVGIEAGTPGDKDGYGMETLTSQAKAASTSEEKVVAGVNGDFYYMVTGEPIGVIHKDGKGIKTSHAAGWDFFGILKDGTPIIGDGETYKEVKDDLEEALGGSALLVKDGYVNEGLSAEREPRTAVGIKEDGSVFFITVDGRQEPYSAGISLLDLGRLMKDMGAVQALNLDGGGSTTYISKKPVSNTLSVSNKPSEGRERRVGNSWLVVTKYQSDGEFATAHIEPFDKSFTPESTVQFKAHGRDKSGEEASLPSNNLTWSLSDDSFGGIDQNGLFSSTGKAGQVEILLSYNGEIVGRTWVEIAVPDKINPSAKQISAEKNTQISLNVNAEYQGRNVKLKNEDIVWEVSEDVGTIDSYGVLYTKDKSGVGKVTAKFKGTNISTTIDVAVGQPSQILWDFEKDISWKVNTTGKGEIVSLEKGVYGKDPVKTGNGSLKINFDFTKGEKNTTLGVYAGPGEDIEVSGRPKGIGMWVYGTPESQGYWMRMALVDGNGQVQNLNLTSESGVDWTGWKYVKAQVPDNIVTPFKISGNQGIRIMSISSGNIGPMTKGNLYIDDIKAIYSEEEEVIVNTTRLAGADRFGTATSIAKKMYTEKASTVVIANGYNFTDQISASTLASSLKAPLLLIGNNAKNDKETIDYLKEHMDKSGKVYIVGGKGAVQDNLVNSIKALGISNIERFEGKDRYDTNIKTNTKLNISEGTPVIIASGEGFADALSIASIAQMNKYPIILTSKNTLTKDAEAYIKKIKPSKAYIVGGEGVVSLNVKNTLSELTLLKDSDIIRLSGSDRYKTNMSVLKHFNINGEAIAIASGVSFPDSLVGSVYATYNNAPIMLVSNSMDLTEQRQYVGMKAYKNIIIFGGSGVVGENLF